MDWKSARGIAVITCFCCSSLPAQAADTIWTINNCASNVSFVTRKHSVVRANGRFTGLSGWISYDGKDPTRATVSTSIPISTIRTGIEQRDKDLISPRYFNVSSFPLASFQSGKIIRSVDGRYHMLGKFTLHGVTRDVDVAFDAPQMKTPDKGVTTLLVTGTTNINQRDYALSWRTLMPDGRSLIDDVIEITLTIKAIAPASMAAPPAHAAASSPQG